MYAADPTSPLALIVDDDQAFRIFSHVSLEEDGLRLEEVASGQAAVDFAATCMPDIVILDIQMPGMDGFTTCQRLRQLPGGDVGRRFDDAQIRRNRFGFDHFQTVNRNDERRNQLGKRTGQRFDFQFHRRF